MTVPQLSVSADRPDASVLVLGVVPGTGEAGPTLLWDAPDLAASLEGIGVSGGRDELTRLPLSSLGAGVAGAAPATSIALIGLGGEPGVETLRYAAGSATRQLAGQARVALALPVSDDAEALAVLEGAAIGAYAFDAYRKSSAKDSRKAVSEVVLVTTADISDSVVSRAVATAAAVHTVRDLVTTPPIDLSPEVLADEAVRLSSTRDVTVTVLAGEELRAGGFGGIVGVGQGSARPPRLVKVVYSPEGATKHLALVGKGITYDTGGLSLKPAGSMVGMKYDMTGAATVLAVTLAAADLALPVKVTAWLCISENMLGADPIRPDDVLTIKNGTTVEVTNTDAEGRLVLADGLSAASEEQPDAIVDVATLTGAQVVALGTRYVGVMGTDDFAPRVVEVADAASEPFWRVPLATELRTRLTSDVADLVNATPGNTAGGMLLAGVFLKEFVGKKAGTDDLIPWAHLDIAGPSENKAGGYGFTTKGATGVTVRTLIDLAAGF
ncbi:putative cytosol aminopeptidase [Frondihabitans sucicola]|uniref:Probable cytosol aminopeptidase n=1 Tax=Frondihabitans sucicola TaxID=1268041 RepID=A0ABM8GQR3_9MICO|nr:leucyl aminopeptidase [Frondihabitans sucicola]BDZ50805.1 putative cytosol aminopeptidase [Frondihabitans sucicola]